MQGERFDAHDFAAQAADKDAVAIVVSRPLPDVSLPQILVADTRIALGQIAAWVRNQLDLQIVAITGSCGKTTVKECVLRFYDNPHRCWLLRVISIMKSVYHRHYYA